MAEYKLKTPISEEEIRKLRVGDIVYISGIIVSARDKAHMKALKEDLPEELKKYLKDGVVYHVGPVVKKINDKLIPVSAGPTTSIRMEPVEHEFIKRFKVRVVVGKGGMGDKTLSALKEFGAVYAHWPGGCGALAVNAIKNVKKVFFLEELGVPDAFWVLEVENFGPLLITMDSHGGSIHKEVSEKVERNFQQILEQL